MANKLREVFTTNITEEQQKQTDEFNLKLNRMPEEDRTRYLKELEDLSHDNGLPYYYEGNRCFRMKW